MDENPKLLTVVIPSYNVEQFIEGCLDSFISAGVPHDLEVLVVNDGSTDGTEAAALRFEKRFPDCFRVISKENGGHGSGINTGIENARGKYFKVVDGDDWVEPEHFIRYLKLLRTIDADLVVTDFCCVSAETLEVTERRSAVIDDAEVGGLHSFADVSEHLLVRMHSVTYRTELLREHDIRIDEHRFYVDMEYIIFPIPFVKTVYVSDIPVYMYRLGLGGQSVSLTGLRRHSQDHIDVLGALLSFYGKCREDGVGEDVLRYICRCICEPVAMQHQIYLSWPVGSGMRKRMMELDSLLLERYPEIYAANTNRAVNWMRRSRYLLFPFATLAVWLLKK